MIFVTAFAEHAVEAFAVNAVDYLLKPVEPARLDAALRRAVRQRALSAMPPGPGVIELKTPRRTLFVTPAEIVAISAEGDFTRVFVAGQAAVMILRTLAYFEGVLPAPPFVRLGRSVMINRDRLRSLEAPTRGRTAVSCSTAWSIRWPSAAPRWRVCASCSRTGIDRQRL